MCIGSVGDGMGAKPRGVIGYEKVVKSAAETTSHPIITPYQCNLNDTICKYIIIETYKAKSKQKKHNNQGPRV